jgi:hypothetical protein
MSQNPNLSVRQRRQHLLASRALGPKIRRAERKGTDAFSADNLMAQDDAIYDRQQALRSSARLRSKERSRSGLQRFE